MSNNDLHKKDAQLEDFCEKYFKLMQKNHERSLAQWRAIEAATVFVNEVAGPVIDMAIDGEPVHKLWLAVRALEALK